MAVDTEARLKAYEAWRQATDTLQAAVYPPVGHESPSMDEKMRLIAELEQRLAEFKAVFAEQVVAAGDVRL